MLDRDQGDICLTDILMEKSFALPKPICEPEYVMPTLCWHSYIFEFENTVHSFGHMKEMCLLRETMQEDVYYRKSFPKITLRKNLYKICTLWEMGWKSISYDAGTF